MMFWPPGLLRIATTLPHRWPRRSASMRAMLSGPEPGGCDRMIFTVLSGQGCARPAPSRPPFDRIAGVFQATAAAHHRLEVGHEKGDVIEGVVVGIRQGDRVMVAVAVHERQGTCPIDQSEAQDRLEEALGRRHVA